MSTTSTNDQPAANLYALTPEQVDFTLAALKVVPLQGTAETLRKTLAMMATIEAALVSPVNHDKAQ